MRSIKVHILSIVGMVGPQLRRHMSITCRGNYKIILLWNDQSLTTTGKPISQEDLFAYTNGSFLFNKKFQSDRHYVKFDLNALCDVAAAAGDDVSPICAIEKMEGGFSKALLMKKQNGSEVVAKIPCRNAGPPIYTTASEVAMLRYGTSMSQRLWITGANLRPGSQSPKILPSQFRKSSRGIQTSLTQLVQSIS